MIDLSRLSETDLFGRFSIGVPGRRIRTRYYNSVDAIRPLLCSDAWRKSVTGFYVHPYEDCSVRLSYFTSSPSLPESIVQKFANEYCLMFTTKETPHARLISKGYGNEELRFRRFLSTYTRIGLEIMAADLLHARRLLATFRWQVMRARQPYAPHFVKTFQSQSPSFKALSTDEQEQLWRDLANWPKSREGKPLKVDWAHLFVHMVLAYDWGLVHFLEPKPPLTIQEISQKTGERCGFEIPEDWQP